MSEVEITNKIIREVLSELDRAREKFKPYNSSHEGYAVIKEELDELWHEVKNNKHKDAHDFQYKEAKQVAVTAIRFMFMCKTN